MTKIVRVDVSPVRLLTEFERAKSALPPGHQCPASAAVSYAVEKLQAVRLAQDVALDESARAAEVPAPRVVPPQGGEAAEP